MRKFLLTLIVVLAFNNLQASQWQHYHSSLRNIVDYQVQKELIFVGAIALPLSFYLDSKVQEFAVKQGFFSDNISNIGDEYGHRKGYVAVACVMAIHSLATGKSRQKSCTEIRLVAEGVLAGQIVIEVLKSATKRKRPNGKSSRSFPSGHTGGAFGLAATLDAIYGKKIGIPAYLMAGFVGLSRINDNKHYLSDVVAGALIGTAVARGFAKNYEKKWQIVPSMNSREKSLTFSYYF